MKKPGGTFVDQEKKVRDRGGRVKGTEVYEV